MAKSENKRRTKGEGSLEFNEKKKKWVARITAHRADGSSFRKTFEGKTQREAKSKRDEWLRHHKEESERIRSNEAFGKYVNEWMENVGRNGIKAQTYKRNPKYLILSKFKEVLALDCFHVTFIVTFIRIIQPDKLLCIRVDLEQFLFLHDFKVIECNFMRFDSREFFIL